nr:hypothetical protein BaRGS_024533 [Batillaria attramentaria]
MTGDSIETNGDLDMDLTIEYEIKDDVGPVKCMLLVGGVLGSAPYVNIAKDIDAEWDEDARQIALAIILIRAGLGLDPAALRRLSFVVVRLAFSPCLSEAITDGIASHLILGFPWEFGLMLGFVIAAVSPAVVVPCLLSLSERGYGVDKGVPTLVIAAASIDDVLAITGFGVTLGIASSTGNLVWNIFKGPVEALLGVIFGIVGGIVLWYIPQKKSKHLLFFRCTMLLSGGLLVIFGSRKVDWDGIGPLGCLTLAFVAAIRWRKETDHNCMAAIADVVGVLWMLFQPLLFGLIGAAVRVDALEAKTVGLGIAVLGIGLGVRMVVAFLAVLGTNLNMKERLFVPVAWLPKATVQAAIGALALDWASENGTEEQKDYATQILILAVLSILLTAPAGAVLVTLLGPRLLHYSHSADRIHRETEMIFEDPEKPDQKPVTSDVEPVTSDHVDTQSGGVTSEHQTKGDCGGEKGKPAVVSRDVEPINVETSKQGGTDDSEADNEQDNTDKRTSITKL